MYLGIYIVIGIIAAIAIFMLVRKSPKKKDHDIIQDNKGKKTQFNPEKVSGMMPEKQMSETDREKTRK